jgi:hypothetical protein
MVPYADPSLIVKPVGVLRVVGQLRQRANACAAFHRLFSNAVAAPDRR